MSMQTLRLLRLAERNHADSSPTNGGPQLRASSPEPGRSTFTTSAPMSPRYIVAVGPAYEVEMSTTRTPSSGWADALIPHLAACARPAAEHAGQRTSHAGPDR